MLSHLIGSYSKIYHSIRDSYPNIYIIIISIIVTMWFQGMTRIADNLFRNTTKNNLIMMIVPVLLLYFGDGKLDEIYNFEGLVKRITAIREINDTSSL